MVLAGVDVVEIGTKPFQALDQTESTSIDRRSVASHKMASWPGQDVGQSRDEEKGDIRLHCERSTSDSSSPMSACDLPESFSRRLDS